MYILPSNVHFAVFCRVQDGHKIRLEGLKKTGRQIDRQTD